jgi:hypothetical protein
MISKIWNWIKNKFKPEKQDPHIVLYEEVEEKKLYVEEYTDKDGKSIKCGTHNRYKKNCPVCREVAGVA